MLWKFEDAKISVCLSGLDNPVDFRRLSKNTSIHIKMRIRDDLKYILIYFKLTLGSIASIFTSKYIKRDELSCLSFPIRE